MVLVQKWPFFQLSFLGNIGQENVCYDILERKNAFLGYKNKKSKKSQNRHFSKGFSLLLWSKIGHFSVFLFQAIQARNMCFTIFQNEKNASLGYKSKKLKKTKNCDFSKGVRPWSRSKISHFSVFLFQAIQARKMYFMMFQKEKTPFQAIKARSSKSQKIAIFRRGLGHGFGLKMGFFPSFYFRQYRPRKCVLGYCRRIKRLSIKTRSN